MKPSTQKQAIIAAGVRNLRDFGYPDCDSENIMTDQVYSAFFRSMLNENKGQGVDDMIEEILTEIEKSQAA